MNYYRKIYGHTLLGYEFDVVSDYKSSSFIGLVDKFILIQAFAPHDNIDFKNCTTWLGPCSSNAGHSIDTPPLIPLLCRDEE